MRRAVRASAWIGLVMVAFTLIVTLALAQTDRAGEEFTSEQRAFLADREPRGRFISQATFRTCQEGNVAYYFADWSFTTTREQCWSHLVPPPLPSFLAPRP